MTNLDPGIRYSLEGGLRTLSTIVSSKHTSPMAEDSGPLRERRWVVVTVDGRYVTLGLNRDPSEEEIAICEEALRSQNISGWLAIMEGNPWAGGPPRLLEVRPLASPVNAFTDAAEACIAAILAKRAEARG